jgi:hypothetical protein
MSGRTYSCGECSFSSGDVHLLEHHSCDIQEQGGTCEDYPACGHEQGDCNGLKYGSDEAIKAEAMAHIYCDHENGQYECETSVYDLDDDEDGE